MMNLESSTVSKSATSGGNTKKAMQLAGKASKFGSLFPFFDQMNNIVRLPLALNVIVAIYFYIQVSLVSLWEKSVFYTITNQFTVDVYNTVFTVFWLKAHTDSEMMITTIVIASIAFISVLWVFFQLYYFQKKKTFLKWALYVSKVIVDIVAPMLVFPSALLFSNSILNLYYADNAVNWAYLVAGALFLVCFLGMFLVGVMFNSNSIILSKTPFPVKDSTVLKWLTLVNVIFVITSNVLSIFNTWLILLIQVVHLGFSVYLLILCTRMSFYQIFNNAMVSSSVFVSMIMDIVMFIMYFFLDVVAIMPIIVYFCTLVAAVISFYLIYKNIERKIVKDLTYTSENMSSEEKTDLFDRLLLSTDSLKANKYLYTGMENACNMFVDMSLVGYLIKSHQYNKTLCSLARVISFFPCETNRLNAIMTPIVNQRNIGYGDRFMIYQLNRIKVLRLSSSSAAETNELLLDLKSINSKCEKETRSFWNLMEGKVSFLEHVGKMQKNATLAWNDALFLYPNNSKISCEYSRYLSETTKDFEAAIYQQQRANLIEKGKNFAVDNCFRCFVQMYPRYLTKEILDIKGCKIKKRTQNQGSTAHSSASNELSFSNQSDFSIDAQLEDSIGKRIFKYPKMRMALHHSISGWKMSIRNWVIFSGLLAFLTSVASFIGIYIYMINIFQRPRLSIYNIYEIGKIRFFEDISILLIWTRWAVYSKRYSNLHLLGNITEADAQFTSFMDFSQDFPYQIMKNMELLKSQLLNLTSRLAELANSGVDVYQYSKTMLQLNGETIFCKQAKVVSSEPSTFKDTMIYLIYISSRLAGSSDLNRLYHQDFFCDLVSNSYNFFKEVGAISTSFADDAKDVSKSLASTLSILRIVIPVVLFVLTCFPIMVFSVIFTFRIKKYMKILITLPQEAKDNAKKPVRIDLEDDIVIAEKSYFMSSIPIFLICFSLISVILSILCYFFIQRIYNTNDLFATYHLWYVQASRRASSSAEATFDLTQIIVLNGTINSAYANRSLYQDYLKQNVEKMLSTHLAITQGTDEHPPYFGYDSYVDTVTFTESCKNNGKDKSVHELYRCGSLVQQIAIFRDMANDISKRPDHYKGKINSETPLNAIHIMTDHLWISFLKVNLNILGGVETNYWDCIAFSSIYLSCGIIIGLILMVAIFFFIGYIDMVYSVFLGLIKQMKPFDIISSKELMNFLLKRNENEENVSMGIAQSVIHRASDAIICTSLNKIVEIINPQVSALLGFTPDQLLGQSVLSIFRSQDADKLAKQIDLMKSGASNDLYDDHVVCISDLSLELQFHITIIGMKKEGSTEISSFVFILDDETQLLKQQNEADFSKNQSEKLLYQILPRDIVLRLNRGEKDISFTVAHATIIFIDIVKFSDYATNLTPQEIMYNLSLFFSSYDAALEKYPIITKIKLIGDVYMAAGGLFGNENDLPSVHAIDTVNFGLDCLDKIEEVNLKLTAQLEVRIGINTGGPLLAGVLGSDKPVFDIIGDAINIAARLQSTDIPGKIQISQNTNDLIQNNNFYIEERGEVFLKGKGKQMTYFVTPPSGFVQFTNSSILGRQNFIEI